MNIVHAPPPNFEAIGHSRPDRRAFLKQVAQRLASPLYGGLISVAEATRIIGAETVQSSG